MRPVLRCAPTAAGKAALGSWQVVLVFRQAKQEQLLQKQAAEAELEAAKRRLTEAETNAAAEIAAAEETTKAKLEEAAQALERQLQDSHEQVCEWGRQDLKRSVMKCLPA